MANEEETKVDTETTDQPEEVEETKTDAEESSEEQAEDTDKTEASDTTNQIDYKAEAEKEESRGKPDPMKARQRIKEKEKEEDDTSYEDESKPYLTREEAESLLDKEKAQLRKEIREGEAHRLAANLAGSEDEKNLILAKWRNRGFPEDMPLIEQIEESYAAANSKKIVGERNEALRALASHGAANTNAAPGRGDRNQNVGSGKIDVGTKQSFIEAGLKYNSTTKRWEKKLGSGKILVGDSKTGRVTPV